MLPTRFPLFNKHTARKNRGEHPSAIHSLELKRKEPQSRRIPRKESFPKQESPLGKYGADRGADESHQDEGIDILWTAKRYPIIREAVMECLLRQDYLTANTGPTDSGIGDFTRS